VAWLADAQRGLAMARRTGTPYGVPDQSHSIAVVTDVPLRFQRWYQLIM
jgi:hypothetical protein